MIRLTFMTDADGVIGVSTPEGNAKRLSLFPPGLKEVMGGLYPAPNVALGAPSIGGLSSPGLVDSTKFVISRTGSFEPPPEVSGVEVCTDFLELVDRFTSSDEELNVIGGLAVFRMFLHHADHLDIAETIEPVAGDLVFDDWREAGFQLESVEDWEGGRTLHYVRKRGELEMNKRSAMAFYDLMFNQNRPVDGVQRYVGAEYIQHNPHVGDGVQPFIDYFERMAIDYPGKRVYFKRAIAEGDLVALHCHQVWPGDEDYAGIDIFRFDAEGKVVEHWDVLQTLPSKSAHDNGMF